MREDSVATPQAQAAGQAEAAMAPLPRTNKEDDMPGNPREMVTMAEWRFRVRIRISVPAGGLDHRVFGARLAR